jgi:signal transduction histidine kinase
MRRNGQIGRIAALLAVCAIGPLVCRSAMATEPKRVLLLYYAFGGNLVNAKQFRAELEKQSPEVVEIYDAPLMSARPVDEAVVARYADYLQALFPDRKLDLAVAVGASAVRLVQRYRKDVFPAAPMLAIAEQRRIAFSDLSNNDVVVASAIDLTKVIDNILRVLPDTNNIAVVIGSSPNERVWVEEMKKTFQPYAGRLSFTLFDNLTFDQILERAATLPPRSAIVHLLLLADAAGTTHEDVKVLPRLYAVANAPIFSYYDINFGNGIVGGPLLSVQERGRITANVALRILHGESPASIKVPPVGLSALKFDWREMQRWGISESRLPPGSQIYFRPLSAWEQYKAQILAICAAFLALTALIGWLIYEHRRRNLAEISARNSMAELTHLNRVATAGELSASIAHEVNQPLTGIVAHAGAALRWLRREQPDLGKAQVALEEIIDAGQRASDVVKSVRAMFRKEAQIGPVDMNRVIAAVLQLMRIELQKQNIELKIRLSKLPAVTGDIVQLQQVILNLVVNAMEAMQSVPTRVLRITSKASEPHQVHVSVEDTGKGIDPAKVGEVFKPLFTTKANGMGMGLAICQSIIENHHGRIWLSPGENGSAMFHIELPTA